MASVFNTSDLTTCTICLESFDNPKSLPCVHAFCLKCIEHYYRDRLPGDTVACPLCRKEFQVPLDGVKSLPHHFIIQQLLDAGNNERPLELANVGESCEVCLAEVQFPEDSVPAATVYCEDCQQKLCEQCSRPHRRWKGGAHNLTPLKAADPDLGLYEGCQKHGGKTLVSFCFDCSENICSSCVNEDHNKHVYQDIAKVASEFLVSFDAEHNKVMSKMEHIQKMREKMSAEKSLFLARMKKQEEAVKEKGENIKRLVDDEVGRLLGELESQKSSCLKQLEILDEKLQSSVSEMKTFASFMETSRSSEKPSEVTRHMGELQSRADSLLKNAVMEEYRPPAVVFVPSARLEKYIGQLNISAGKDNPVGEAIHTLPYNESVWGLASLGNEVFLLFGRQRDQIDVIDADSFNFRRKLTVPMAGTVNDLAACRHYHCLYVADARQSCVHRVDTVTAAATLWSVSNQPCSLSVTVGSHNVLVTSRKARLVKEFTSHGKLLRTISLPQDINTPWQAIQISAGQFVVCHGEKGRDQIHRVCVVDQNGQILRSYGGRPGSGADQLNVPIRVTVDDRRRRVLVVDHQNLRILSLPTDLQAGDVTQVVSRDQCRWLPHRVYLDADRGRLYVAEIQMKGRDWTSGRVVVYSV